MEKEKKTQAYGSARRVLSVPELLSMVLASSNKETQASCARVCKAWNCVALDCLWKSLSSVKPLIQLLPPIPHNTSDEESSFDNCQFIRPLLTYDWTRFLRYSKRVKSIRINSLGVPYISSPLIIKELALTRPQTNILPNLVELTVEPFLAGDRDITDACFLFMSGNVSRLTIRFSRMPKRTGSPLMKRFLKEACVRMPRLEYFKLETLPGTSIAVIEVDLKKLFSRMPTLKHVTFPIYGISDSLVTALSKNQSLHTLDFEYCKMQHSGNRRDMMLFNPKFVKGAFPALVDLSLTAHLLDMHRFFAQTYAPAANLTHLYISSIYFERASRVDSFFNLLKKKCPKLKYLGLDLIPDFTDNFLLTNNAQAGQAGGGTGDEFIFIPTTNSEEDIITLAHLKQLTDFQNLKSICITYHRALSLSDEDLETLVRAWPTVEELSLNNEPTFLCSSMEPSSVVYVPRHLTLDAFRIVAQHALHIRSLSLYIDATKASVDYSISKIAEILTPSTESEFSNNKKTTPLNISFKQLQQLNVGISPIDEVCVEQIASYLATLFINHSKLLAQMHNRKEMFYSLSLASPLPGTRNEQHSADNADTDNEDDDNDDDKDPIFGTGITWSDRVMNKISMESWVVTECRISMWREVFKAVPVFLRAKLEERKREETLEKEVVDLRARVMLLQDQLHWQREEVKMRANGEGGCLTQ